MQPNLIDAFSQIVGPEHVLTGKEDLLRYAYEVNPGLSQMPDVVITPANSAEVSKVLALANAEKIPVSVRGSATNIYGTTTPAINGIILLMNRMGKILEIDTANLTVTLEPGVTVAELKQEVQKSGFLYPPDPGTVVTATMGGMIAQNMGSLFSLKYGVAKHYVMGLEVVLADGRILETGGKNVKDVAGYDLTKLIVGSKGTLGVITKITVKLMPEPESRKSVLAVFNSLTSAAKTLAAIEVSKVLPSALEIWDKTTLQAIENYSPIGLPTVAEAILLIEVDGIQTVVDKDAANIIELLQASDTTKIVIAETTEDRDKLWAIRRAALPALTKLNPSVIVGDATVPRSRTVDMLLAIQAIAINRNVTIGTFGHAGDGNLYATIICDHRKDNTNVSHVAQAMNDLAAAAKNLNGNIDGVGGQLGTAGKSAMKAVKLALDPNGILNPEKQVKEG